MDADRTIDNAAAFWPEITPDEGETLDNETLTIADRRVRVAAAYCARKSMRTIATELKCSFGTVQGDLKAVFEGWKRMAVRSMAEQIADALMRLTERETDIEREWEKSKGSRTETHSEQTGGDRPSSKAKVRKREGYGDPRLAALLIQCWDRRCKLLGLLRPEDFRKIDALPPVKYVAGLDPAEVV